MLMLFYVYNESESIVLTVCFTFKCKRRIVVLYRSLKPKIPYNNDVRFDCGYSLLISLAPAVVFRLFDSKAPLST